MGRIEQLKNSRNEIEKEIERLQSELLKIDEQIEELKTSKTVISSGKVITDFATIMEYEWENDANKKKVVNTFITHSLKPVLEDDFKMTSKRIGNSLKVTYYESWMEDFFRGMVFYVIPHNEEYYVFLILEHSKPITDKQRETVRNFNVLKDIKYKSQEYDCIDDMHTRERIVFMTRYRTKHKYSNERIWDDFLTIKHFAMKQVPAKVIHLKNLSNVSVKNDDHEHTLIKTQITIPTINKGGSIGSTEKVNAYYCKRCDCYFLSDATAAAFRRQHIVLFVKDPYARVREGSFEGDLETQSLLNKCGYNVNATTNYSTKQRHVILDEIIKNKMLTPKRIMDYLSYFVRRSVNQEKLKQANEKWSIDLRYLHERYN